MCSSVSGADRAERAEAAGAAVGAEAEAAVESGDGLAGNSAAAETEEDVPSAVVMFVADRETGQRTHTQTREAEQSRAEQSRAGQSRGGEVR